MTREEIKIEIDKEMRIGAREIKRMSAIIYSKKDIVKNSYIMYVP